MVKDETERSRFIKENLGLVHTICKRFAGKGIEYDDLFQSGCMGLVKAYDAFDEDRGLCFSTYAVPVIMGCVRRLFRDGGSVKVSRSVKELGLRINREKGKYQLIHGEEPTIKQLAELLSVDAEEITEALCATQPTVSISFEGENGLEEMDLPTVSHEEHISQRISIEQALNTLDEKEREIIKCRYFSLLTQSKTAKLLNMSQVQVSRAEKKILIKLREVLKP